MKTPRENSGMDRRHFLVGTSGSLLAAAMPAAGHASDFSHGETMGRSAKRMSSGASSKRKIPIGVFDPVYEKLSLDQMLDKVSALGLEAMEIGTGGYPNNTHCPLDELVADPAKAKAWQKKFTDKSIRVATLSCHGNPLHPNAQQAGKDQDIFKKTVKLAQMLDIK